MARSRHTPRKPQIPPKAATPNVKHKPKIEATHVEGKPLEDDEPIGAIDPPTQNRGRRRIFILTCFVAGCLNSYNGYALFENDCYFSHLSNLEREMTFRTEMGLYYSYFKVLANAPTASEGFHKLLLNNRTEYPATINTLQRFNLYPEVVLGIAHRIFTYTASLLGISAKNCWTVTRSENHNAVESCSGLGDPAVFYMTSVYLWNFITGASLAALAGLLSESFLGIILCCALYFFNFEEATRVQWTPPLRESFAYPLLVFQMYLSSRLIRCQTGVFDCILYVIVTTSSLLCWQFSQFVLATQISCLFVIFTLHAAIDGHRLRYISCMHLCSMFVAYFFLFFNDMLFCSLYTAVVIACIVTCEARLLNGIKRASLKLITRLGSFAVITITLKLLLAFVLRVEDDSHVWGLLRSKISDYRDFDTMLYTCAPEFDFLQMDYITTVGKSLGFALVLLVGVCARAFWSKMDDRNLFPPEFIYNFYQCSVFAVMAYTVMRLKIFLTPHLCILSAVSLNPRYYVTDKTRLAIATALLAILMIPGIQTIYNQHSHRGEYLNPSLEELMIFIDDYAEPNESFAGPMPLMANIMLSTGRPIVNHPHYENASLREKTKIVYTLLSRKPMKEVYGNLKSLHVRHIVIPRTWCFGKMRTGCSLTGIWDKLDPENRNNPLVCERLLKDDTEKFFETVFQNDEYAMLSLM